MICYANKPVRKLRTHILHISIKLQRQMMDNIYDATEMTYRMMPAERLCTRAWRRVTSIGDAEPLWRHCDESSRSVTWLQLQYQQTQTTRYSRNNYCVLLSVKGLGNNSPGASKLAKIALKHCLNYKIVTWVRQPVVSNKVHENMELWTNYYKFVQYFYHKWR